MFAISFIFSRICILDLTFYVRPYVLEWFNQVFLTAFNEKTEPSTKLTMVDSDEKKKDKEVSDGKSEKVREVEPRLLRSKWITNRNEIYQFKFARQEDI
jgi:hypothetical protein